MTILGIFLIKEIRTGGDRRYLELMEDLAGRGNNVFVIMNSYLDYKPVHLNTITFPIKYKRRSFPPGSYLFKRGLKQNIPAIRKLHDKEQFEILHIHGDMHLKAALYIKKKLGIPLFYASRNNDIERDKIIRKSGLLSFKQYLFNILYSHINISREKQIARNAALITFQSTGDMGDFVKRTHCEEKKIVIIPGNIGPPRFSESWKNKNTSSSVKNIIFIGSPLPSKGFTILISALGLLKQKGYSNFNCHVLMRLEGSTKEKFIKLIHDANLTENIVFEGFKDPFPYLAESDLLVYPALYDAFPDVLLEALHTGCPVIASNTGGIPDILSHKELLFNPYNIEEIVDIIIRCIDDTSFYQNIRHLCNERAAMFYFDWAERFESAINSFLKGTLSVA
ncbi:MAG: glycosyltransferase family 4 protein [Endomicrobium sp.]|jgi:glycosyltransferase involved in cell wall biosynthesis|nr:glycosyltransferase family 4 protein [Endomicrobium sp.]